MMITKEEFGGEVFIRLIEIEFLVEFARTSEVFEEDLPEANSLIEKGLMVGLEDGDFALTFNGIEYLRSILNVRVPDYESPDATAESIIELESRSPSDDSVQ